MDGANIWSGDGLQRTNNPRHRRRRGLARPHCGCRVNSRRPSAEGAKVGAQALPTEVGSQPGAASPGRAAAIGEPAGAAVVPSKAANMAAGAAGEGAGPQQSVYNTYAKLTEKVIEYF